ncbi:MAG: bile acid:sodium symporter [Burkholderiaceae bacterium]
MPVSGPIPEQLLTIVAAATVFAVMFDLGLGIVLREFRWVLQHPGLILRGLFAVLVAVPVLALVVVRAFDLPRGVEIGIVLMAIAPGAPVALRRSLGAGGHRAFAPALQILVALLAVVSMPLTIAALNQLYSGKASLDPRDVARQVFLAQLLPLGLGIVVRQLAPRITARAEPILRRLATLLLPLLVMLVLIDIAPAIMGTRSGVAIAIVLLTALAAGTGHALGGPHSATRTAVAVCAAARNPGLALLVATLNAAPPGVVATIFAYLVFSFLTLIPYVAWSRRRGGGLESAESAGPRDS